MKHSSKGELVGTSKAAKTANVQSAAPKSAARHKNPKMTPVGSKAMTGGKTK